MARKKPLLLKQRVRGQNYAGQEQSFGAAKLSLLFSSAEPWKTMQLWTWKATVEKRRSVIWTNAVENLAYSAVSVFSSQGSWGSGRPAIATCFRVTKRRGELRRRRLQNVRTRVQSV
mmetsp:Transcript_941/g.1542  ORF Transcript_941/g.1542 Transcript_941/m.1542 type:complete len:117 (-) Transcript_941:25-375(-)